MKPVVGVLALQGDVPEHLAALRSAGADAVPVRRQAELAALDGIVLPGGESTAIDRLLRAFDLFGPLRERLRAGLPAYGSCAGMVLLADRVLDGTVDQQTLGGLDVTVRRNAFGRQVDSFETDLDVDQVPGPVRAVFIRAPWVEAVGPAVTVLARACLPAPGTPRAASREARPAVEDGPAAGTPASGAAGRIVAVRQGVLLATSFHPEVTGDDRVHRLFVDMVRGNQPKSLSRR
ncbi:MAG: pyridoxal 5'-phosphate synthase glutaminase subunit PdxT [Micrococcales bacterium]|nr:pyridoxal 5'-phosphate synthase glutaminase subunit PdxT [Micrococcales bacterium]